VDGSGDGSCVKSSCGKIGDLKGMSFWPGVFIAPTEAVLCRLFGVCPASESRISRIELRDGDSALRRASLEEFEVAETPGRSSEGRKGVSDSDPDSKLFDNPSVSSMNVTGGVSI
jgi:hypothetical protein